MSELSSNNLYFFCFVSVWPPISQLLQELETWKFVDRFLYTLFRISIAQILGATLYWAAIDKVLKV